MNSHKEIIIRVFFYISALSKIHIHIHISMCKHELPNVLC